jgi:hypothetical protein
VSLIVNLTKSDVAHSVGMGLDGRWQVTAVVKTSYVWDQAGRATLVEPTPIVALDELASELPSAGLLRASELGPPKPKVDVLLAGAIAFPRPITQTDVEMAVGQRLRKKARIFGDRVWLPGAVADLVPSQARPTSRVPIAWERSYGGEDPSDPKYIEPRNPAGSGVARDPKSLHGRPAPNFEDADKATGSLLGLPEPVGFGPIAAHWQPRIKLAGTYDEAWETSRRPLPPEDFSPAYFNVAPVDQQLDGYQPGEIVGLLNMTTEAREQFSLPTLTVPVTFVSSDDANEGTATIDTIIIEPEARRFSLVAKAQATLAEGPQSLDRIVVGELTRGMRQALETGRYYPWSRRGSKPG